ncbi:hypothetical protein PanWU01x14_208100, partial [Parasponia andersonii]
KNNLFKNVKDKISRQSGLPFTRFAFFLALGEVKAEGRVGSLCLKTGANETHQKWWISYYPASEPRKDQDKIQSPPLAFSGTFLPLRLDLQIGHQQSHDDSHTTVSQLRG